MSIAESGSTLAQSVVDAIRSVVGPGSVSLHEPRFAGHEWVYVKDCLDSTFVSSVGAYVDRFEAELAALTGAKSAVAVVNGTAALHVALRLAGVQVGDEVLVPALTFVATPNAVTYCGATPHFDYVAGEVAKGTAQVMLDTGVPVLFGVLTTDSIEQAIERAGTKAGNKGADVAVAALEMVNLLNELGQAQG